MNYISTRGRCPAIGFQEAVMTGLSRDGGLLLPERIPDIRSCLSAWKALSYRQLAFEIMRLYVDIPDAELKNIIERSYADFRHPEVTPVVSLDSIHILELFHGPTFAFKDIALQWLGNVFEYILSNTNRHLNILAATSGDTGSAAIYGVKGRKKMRIFVLYPYQKISMIQERQMTTVLENNVFNIAIKGSFDDCQNIVKNLFQDLAFKDQYMLGSVNSINWARLLAQIVYYFYATFRVMESCRCQKVRFCVPTGNFGDIFAGYLACKMGLPVGLLVLATNENDILARFFRTGCYKLGKLYETLSPSMDIQVASNFERYLYYRINETPATVCKLMKEFGRTGELRVAPLPSGKIDSLITADSCNTDSCRATIKQWYQEKNYLLDPHTAIGIHTAQSFLNPDEPMICLATAHPAKFPDVIRKATGKDIAHHKLLEGLNKLPIRRTILPASTADIRSFIRGQTL